MKLSLMTVLANGQSVYIVLKYKPQPRDGSGVLRSAGYEVYARRFDARMPQYIREPCDVTAGSVKHFREKMAQVAGKDFARLHPGALAQGLHVPPGVRFVQRLARLGGEHRPGGLFLRPDIFLQQPPQLVGQEHDPPLALVADLRPACTVSTVIKRSSLTRMPVAQMV